MEGESSVEGVDVGDEDADGFGVDVLADLRGDDVECVVDFLLLAELVDEDADGASAGLGVGEQAAVFDLQPVNFREGPGHGDGEHQEGQEDEIWQEG